jgi:hypothetical protein
MYALESSPVASDWVSGDSRAASEGRTGSDGCAPSSFATRRHGPAVSPVRRTLPRSSMPDRAVSASLSAELATPGATRSSVSKPAATPDAASPAHSTSTRGSSVPSPVERQSVAPARPSTRSCKVLFNRNNTKMVLFIGVCLLLQMNQLIFSVLWKIRIGKVQ